MRQESNAAGIDAFEAGTFTKVVRPAAGLRPPETTAVRSIFKLGKTDPANDFSAERAPPIRRQNSRRVAEALAFIGSRPFVTCEEIAAGLELPHVRATHLLSYLKTSGRILSAKVEGEPTRFRLNAAAVVSASTFPSNAPTASTAQSGPAEPAARADQTPAHVADIAALETLSDRLVCGLFSNGELLLELGKKTVRLSRQQVRDLTAYLDLVSSALQESAS